MVNALSEKLEVIIEKDNKRYNLNFKKGKKIDDIKITDINNSRTSTYVRFYPDFSIFNNIINFDIQKIKNKLLELSFLCPGLELEFFNENSNDKSIFKNNNNLSDFVKFLASPSELISEPIVFQDNKSNIDINCALQWFSNKSDEIYRCYTNNINNLDGGSHLIGFRSALTRTVNNYISVSGIKISLSGDDVREGLVYIISIKHPDPKFISQTKDKLVSEDVRTIIENSISKQLLYFFEQNPVIAKKIINQCINSYKAREAAKKAREAIRKSVLKDNICLLPGKLSDCSSKNSD